MAGLLLSNPATKQRTGTRTKGKTSEMEAKMEPKTYLVRGGVEHRGGISQQNLSGSTVPEKVTEKSQPA